jgi:biopolymer transport protein ExbB
MWQFFIKGGIMMIPLGFCSILGFIIVIERILYYSLHNQTPERAFKQLKHNLNQGKVDEAKYLAAGWRTPLGRIIESVINQYKNDSSLVEQIAQNAGEQELRSLQRGLSLLDTVVTASPLLGLLGTVTGIIKSFTALSVASGGQAIQLSAGVAEALYNTAFGLAIAIPALFFVNIFYGIAEKRARELTCCTQEILAILHKDR